MRGRSEAVLWQVDLSSGTVSCWQPRGGFGVREAPSGDGLAWARWRWSKAQNQFSRIAATDLVCMYVCIYVCAQCHIHIAGLKDRCHLGKYFIIFYGLLSLGSADTLKCTSKCCLIDYRPLWKTTISVSAARCTCVREVHCQQDSGWASIHIFLTFKRAGNLPEALIKMGWIKTRLGIVVLGVASFTVHKMVCTSIREHGEWVWALLGHLVGIHPQSVTVLPRANCTSCDKLPEKDLESYKTEK